MASPALQRRNYTPVDKDAMGSLACHVYSIDAGDQAAEFMHVHYGEGAARGINKRKRDAELEQFFMQYFQNEQSTHPSTTHLDVNDVSHVLQHPDEDVDIDVGGDFNKLLA